jgi:2'-5' RNA ligase
MPYAIEMFFDSSTAVRIRRLWENLALAGASFMRDGGARPHVSLAVCDTLDVSGARDLIDGFARKIAPIPVTLASLGVFPSASPVMFLAPKVTVELLQIHSEFFTAFDSLGHGCWSHYSPLHWIPHCTVAMHIDAQQLSGLGSICLAADLPISGTLTEIGLVEFSPVRHLHSAPFTPNSDKCLT